MHHDLQVDELIAGEVGYLAASIKAVADARVGDTITLKKNQAEEALAGYQQVMPMVYCGLFPTDADQFETLREALGRLQLNDAALQYEPEVHNLELSSKRLKMCTCLLLCCSMELTCVSVPVSLHGLSKGLQRHSYLDHDSCWPVQHRLLVFAVHSGCQVRCLLILSGSEVI